MIEYAKILRNKGTILAVKNDIEEIKKELSSQEQFLENMIKGERFIKKHKTKLISALVLVILVAAGYEISSYFKEQNQNKANEIYSSLLKNPNDKSLQESLAKLNPSLFALFAIETSKDLNSTKLLQEALEMKIDPILSDVIKYLIGKDSGEFMANYGNLVRGYESLKQNKITKARIQFDKIPTSEHDLTSIYKNLEHYQGN